MFLSVLCVLRAKSLTHVPADLIASVSLATVAVLGYSLVLRLEHYTAVGLCRNGHESLVLVCVEE